ncbi:MAG TPA: GGDEF domain-containing protein [Desulfuromonadales bacterium]|nr:GGDEF domain-containing protein [Desulfuromonadales bacterium]
MNLNELLNIKARNNPDSLLRLLITVAFISIAVVVIVSGYGFYRIFAGFVIKNAENDTVRLCKVLIEQQKELMFVTAPGNQVVLGLHGTETLAFDRSLRHYLTPFNIIKVKVYTTGKKIVYCTDPMLIGKIDQDNLRLKNALNGNIDAKMVTKEKARDLADEELLDVDVVETYVPIRAPDNKILGSFEVYMNITEYRDQIRMGAMVVTLLMSFVMVGVFGFAYLLMRGGTVQLKEVQAQLEMIAITDPLTDIPNRGFLITRGDEEFERMRRSARPLGCIMLDLDHFKRVNDTKGHLAGDCVLKEMALRLKNSVRPYDVIGRYGGEEFVVLLPDTTFEQSLLVAERIREKIRCESFLADGNRLKITVSLGVAVSNETDRSLSDMIKRADEGLYKAKADGRDRVSWMRL